jgi:hypothetical protein
MIMNQLQAVALNKGLITTLKFRLACHPSSTNDVWSSGEEARNRALPSQRGRRLLARLPMGCRDNQRL